MYSVVKSKVEMIRACQLQPYIVLLFIYKKNCAIVSFKETTLTHTVFTICKIGISSAQLKWTVKRYSEHIKPQLVSYLHKLFLKCFENLLC